MRARDIRGIPLWLLREYLVEAGGRPEGAEGVRLAAKAEALEIAGTTVRGAGWTARLRQIDDYRIGNLAVGQVRLELDGEPDALDALEARLAPKLLRGGG